MGCIALIRNFIREWDGVYESMKGWEKIIFIARRFFSC